MKFYDLNWCYRTWAGRSALLFTAILFLLFSAAGYAQNYAYEQITIEQGLVSNTVYTIHSDTTGYIWIGTDNGLQRFNGREWEQFNVSNAPIENEVFEIYDDPFGGLIFSGMFGCHYKWENDSIYPFPGNAILNELCGSELELKGFIPSQDFSSAIVSIPDIGMIEVHANSYDTIHPLESAPQIVDINERAHYQQGAKQDHPEYLEVQTKSFTGRIQIDNFHANRNVFLENHADGFCLSTKHEVYLFRDGTYSKRNFDKRVLNISCTENYFVACLQNGGLSFINDSSLNPGFKFLEKQTVTGFAEDIQEGLWISTLENGVFHIKNLGVQIYHHNYGESERIITISPYKSGIITTSLYGTYMIIEGNELKETDHILNSNEKIIDAATYNGDYYVLGSNSGSFYNFTTQETLDTPELIGNKMHGYSNHFLNYSKARINILSSENQSIKKSEIYFIGEDQNRPEGYIEYCTLINDSIFFTAGNTLNIVDEFQSKRLVKDRNKVTYTQYERCNKQESIATAYDGIRFLKDTTAEAFREKDGLSSNSIRKLCYDPYGYLWVATEAGLDCISQTEGKVLKQFKASDGISSVKINELYTDSNFIYIGTMDGLTVIDRDISFNSQPYFIGLTINEQPLSHEQAIRLKYDEELAVHFDLLDFHNKELNIRYRFGSGSDWIHTNQADFRRKNVKWGHYEFECAHQLRDKSWSNTTLVHIYAARPWWASPIVIITLLILSIFLIRYLIKIQKRRITIKLRQENLQHYYKQQLARNKMDPHFLFNGLSSALYYIESGQIEAASNYVSDFSELLRSSLSYSQDDLISIENELDFITSYCSIESKRLELNMKTHFSVSPKLNPQRVFIPSMVVQPLVENAIWHGLGTIEDDRKLEVNFIQKKNRLIVKVIDNGVGLAHNSKKKSQKKTRLHASDFIRKRFTLYSQIYDSEFSLRYANDTDDPARPGTVCTIEIPLLRSNKLRIL